MGSLVGTTAGYWAYLLLSKNGFTFFPYKKHKIGQYTIIFGSVYIAFKIGQAKVAYTTSDRE